MTKKTRFPCRVDCWMSEQFAQAIEAIADARAMTTSSVVREALAIYLHNAGMLPPPMARPAPNGKPQGEMHGN